MAALLTAVTDLIDALGGKRSWVEELTALSQKVARHFSRAKRADVDEALRRFAALLPTVPMVALGHVAINCGSLVENGGDPGIAGPALLDKLPRVNEMAIEFCTRCRALAEADEELLEELRAQSEEDAGEESDNEDDDRDRTPIGLVSDHVANAGWGNLAQRFGPVLYRQHPIAVLGHMAEEFSRLGLISHLSRSKPLRAAARARPELLEQTRAADAAARRPG